MQRWTSYKAEIPFAAGHLNFFFFYVVWGHKNVNFMRWAAKQANGLPMKHYISLVARFFNNSHFYTRLWRGKGDEVAKRGLMFFVRYLTVRNFVAWNFYVTLLDKFNLNSATDPF
jgi:hypothetical protein